jgi:hypothetical protein
MQGGVTVIELESVLYRGEATGQHVAADSARALDELRFNGELKHVDLPMLLGSAEGDEWVAEQDMQEFYRSPNALLPWSSLWARQACHESISAERQIELYELASAANKALVEALKSFVEDMN